MSEESSCGCGEHQEVSTDDIAKHSHFMVNVIMKALVNKGVLSNDDINQAVTELQEMATQKQD